MVWERDQGYTGRLFWEEEGEKEGTAEGGEGNVLESEGETKEETGEWELVEAGEGEEEEEWGMEWMT